MAPGHNYSCPVTRKDMSQEEEDVMIFNNINYSVMNNSIYCFIVGILDTNEASLVRSFNQ